MARLSDDLWIARMILEERREGHDPSTVFLGELANLLEEQGISGLVELRIKLDYEVNQRRARKALQDSEYDGL